MSWNQEEAGQGRAGQQGGWMAEATVACSDWHSKIDFHYIFVGGIGNVIMSRGGRGSTRAALGYLGS